MPSIEKPESELVRRAMRGDTSAFGDLYEQYLNDIYRYIYYRVSNHQDAEDLAERVFLKGWQSLMRYQDEKVSFKAWIYRIAHNTVVDYYRTRQEMLPLNETHRLPDVNPCPEAQILEKEEVELLAKLITRLSPTHQHVLALRFINGLSTEEVAQVIDRSTGAVRVLQHRALKALHAFLMAEEITHV